MYFHCFPIIFNNNRYVFYYLAQWVEQRKKIYFQKCEDAFQQDNVKMLNKYWLDSNWKGFFPKDGKIDFNVRNTGVNHEILKHIGLQYSTPPDCEFNLHTGRF